MREVPLTQGYVALLDDEDYEWISSYKWCVARDRRYQNKIYAMHITRVPQTTIRMHRLIMGVADPKLQVDHKDHNGLNNQRSNLRIATQTQNVRNTTMRRLNTSGYKGVFWFKPLGIWHAKIGVDGKRIFLGCFHDPKMAALAYDEAALKYHGEFASTNKMLGNLTEPQKGESNANLR